MGRSVREQQKVTMQASLDDYDGSLLYAILSWDDVFTLHMIPHMTPHDLGVLVCTSARVRAFVGGKRITTQQQKYFYDVMFGRALTANIGTAIYSMPVEKLDLDIATLP